MTELTPNGHVTIVMGVAGSGKTTVGRALATALGGTFFDADDYHPPGNIAKMAAGEPLDDADRDPWLARLRDLVIAQLEGGHTAVLACSALKHAYRRVLQPDPRRVRFVYLAGDYATIWQRISARGAHYMPPALLASQFAALEPPGEAEALVLPITLPLTALVAAIVADLRPL